MAQKTSRGATPHSPESASNDIRRGAQAMRAGGGRLSLIETERQALVEWAQGADLILPHQYTRQFRWVSAGAEHTVYHDECRALAIKVTYPNRFGHSPYGPGFSCTPVEYFTRLAWQNALFGDDIKVLGVIAEDDHVEIVTSQPWLQLHSERPRPYQNEIDFYFEETGFVRVPWGEEVPLYYSRQFDIVALDAHDLNVVRDSEGMLMAIDIVLGTPGPRFRKDIDDYIYGPSLFD